MDPKGMGFSMLGFAELQGVPFKGLGFVVCLKGSQEPTCDRDYCSTIREPKTPFESLRPLRYSVTSYMLATYYLDPTWTPRNLPLVGFLIVISFI